MRLLRGRFSNRTTITDEIYILVTDQNDEKNDSHTLKPRQLDINLNKIKTTIQLDILNIRAVFDELFQHK